MATVNAGDGGWLLIDADRRVVAASTEAPALPIVDGVGLAAVGEELAPDAQAAIDVAAALTPALRTRVAVVNGADPRAIELTLQPSGRVEFGPATAIDERIRSLQTVFATVDLVCLDTIDLAAGQRRVEKGSGVRLGFRAFLEGPLNSLPLVEGEAPARVRRDQERADLVRGSDLLAAPAAEGPHHA